MKIKLITLLCLIMAAIAAYARLETAPPHNNSTPPGLPLPIAYSNAIVALGALTNQFYCVSANIKNTFSPQGEWFFTFSATNSAMRWVTVEFNGKTRVQDFLPPE